ncbi:MAG: BamA/TamA family outer membrane protein [Acidobacteriaceae bacterium]|nr:BamA/TamA family outer membrane protein [Acidobacteriaceae bacterium]
MIPKLLSSGIRTVIFLSLLKAPLFSEPQDFAGKTVVAIEYSPASQPVDRRDLENMQLVKVGEPLQMRQVAASIDRLFSSGLYDDIQVDAEPDGTGVRIRFITKARRFIGHVGAAGDINDPPSRGVIISDSGLTLGQRFRESDLEAARETIESELRQNGLYEATVTTVTIEDPVLHQVTVRFLVAAGKRARYETPIIKGDPKLSDGAIIRATGWRLPLIKRWRKITQALNDKGTDGIEKKYAKAERLTASVDLERMDYDADVRRARPTLNINAGPKITIRALEAKVSKSKLRKYIPVYQEGSVDPDLLAEGARNLHDYFQSKGYPDVDVTFKEEPQRDDEQVINYYIATGPRRRLVNINIIGNNYFADDTLHERMFLRTNSILLRYGRYSENFRHQDEGAIENLYRANGFRDVRVTSTVETNYKEKPSDLSVTFRIRPGTQWTVSHLKIEGNARLNLAPIESRFAAIEGQPYAESNIATDRSLILSYYYSHGFPSASFSYTVVPDTETHTVDLVYRLREGPQEFVRKVILSGLNRTRPSMVEKQIKIEDGEPLNMTKVNAIARELSDLGVFANVNTGIQDPDGTNRYKYVLYDFDEAGRYTFNVGLGLEIGQFGYTTNNVSSAGGAKGISPIFSFGVNRLNFRGLGETLAFQVRYSSLEQRESISYIVPRFLGSNRTITFTGLYDATQDVQTFSSRRLEASVQTSQRLTRASTVFGRFSYRRVSTGNINIPSLLIPQFSQPVRIGMLSAGYIQDHRDDPADAHRGFWNTIDAGLAGKFFGSQRNFARVLARNATYTPIGRNLVFARQTQVGVILPFNNPGLGDYEAIPLPERFFGGGSVSMRGFGDNQAGPRDIGTPNELPGEQTATPTGFPIGGNALLFNTFELRFPLLGPNISGVFFHDMGNIYTTPGAITLRYRQPSEQDFNYAVQAAGFGIRYKTPLGPIRVDLSYALNPPHYLGFSNSYTTQELLQCGSNEIGNPAYPQCNATPQRLSHFQFFFSIGQAF